MSENRIEVLYGPQASTPGANQPAGQPPTSQIPEPKAQREEALYGDEKPQQAGNPFALADTREDRFYGGTNKVELSGDTDLSVIYDTPEDQAALRDNLGYMAAETGATQTDVHAMVTRANELMITGEIPNAQESMKTLYEQHGEGLPAKLDDAMALVSTLPELGAWLESSGAGNDPKIVNQFIRLAATERSQARLKLHRGK